MLNQRDGGIGGIKLIIEECETGYDTKKGVELIPFGERQEPGRRHAVVYGRHAATDPESGGR